MHKMYFLFFFLNHVSLISNHRSYNSPITDLYFFSKLHNFVIKTTCPNKNKPTRLHFFNTYLNNVVYATKYFNISLDSLLLINFLFNANSILKNRKLGSLRLFNLNIYSDWYFHNFVCRKIQIIDYPVLFEKHYNFFKIKNIQYSKKIITKYVNFYNLDFLGILKKTNLSYTNMSFLFNIFVLPKLNIFFKNTYFIKYKNTSVSKYINYDCNTNYNFFYLRKNKIFNKGRYSRNRQLYRTGVYWCIWVNIIFVYGLYFLFYRFSFNFGYIWWGIFILIFSFLFSRSIKYNYHNILNIIKEFNLFFVWLCLILKEFYSSIKFKQIKWFS